MEPPSLVAPYEVQNFVLLNIHQVSLHCSESLSESLRDDERKELCRATVESNQTRFNVSRVIALKLFCDKARVISLQISI